MKNTSRRNLLCGLVAGSAGIALRSAVTGLPASFLINPIREARADDAVAVDAARAQILVLAVSDAGEPINVNGPGAYAYPAMNHSIDPAMQGALIKLGSAAHVAAQSWTTVPQWALDRAAFIQHATFAGQHGTLGSVLRLMGRAKALEMIPAIFAKYLSVPLKTIQQTPISAGVGEVFVAGGVRIPNASPLAWKELVGQYDAVPDEFQKIRDRTTDKMYAALKKNGTRAQLRYLDQLAKSSADAKRLGGDVANLLGGITDDGNDAQLTAAIAIAKMNISPVIGIKLDFGGDNHNDPELRNEAIKSKNAISALARFFATLKANGLEDKVTFASLGVFGRNFRVADLHGRDHWASHSTSIIVGKNVNAGLFGGTVARFGDYSATGIDSVTGKGIVDGGDIKYDDTLAAFGKTLGAVLGISAATLEAEISGGKIIQAAITY
jgi:Protein of unknown function (DUF1501)